jgi:hypothetical protein
MKKEQDKTELTPFRIIRSETVLSRYPLHRLSRSADGVNIELRRTNEFGEVIFNWKVSYINEYGQPGPLAYKLDTLIINRRIEEAGQPVPKHIRLGSLREIAEELDLGRDTNSVKKALHQNASAYIVAKVRYVTKKGKEKTAEFGKNRYGVVFAGEKLSDGTTADSVYLELNDWYREILETAVRRPLDYDYLKELPPTAQRLYELLSYKVYAALKHGRDEAKYLYSDFCAFAPQTRYFEYDQVKKQMYKIHSPHKKGGFILSTEFKETTDDDGKRDWEILYTVGPKARAEHKAFAPKRGALPESAKALLPFSVHDDSEEDGLGQTLVVRLLQHGVDERTARELVEHDANEVATQLELFPFRNLRGVESPTGWLIDAIRKKYQAPKSVAAKKAKAEKGMQGQKRRELALAREAHQDLHHKAFSAYLDAELRKLIKANGEAYRAFTEEFRSFVAVLQDPSPETIKESQPYVFGKFAEENPSLGVLTFWEWDEKLNPEPFRAS